MYRGGLDTTGNEHVTSLYKPAREWALIKRNIIAGWTATASFPLNPESVLRHTDPPAELTDSKANKVVSCPQDQLLQAPIPL